jgi:ZIP family zinc transporter
MALALASASLTFCSTMLGGLTARFLLADALAPLLGALIATLVPIPDEVFPVALGVFSGFFIYAATANLLPSAHDSPPLGPSRRRSPAPR